MIKRVFVLSPRRCGHHAIIDYILGHRDYPKEIEKDSRGHRFYEAAVNLSAVVLPNVNQRYLYNKLLFPNLAFHDLQIVNFENTRIRIKDFLHAPDRYYVFVLRDFYNFIASSMHFKPAKNTIDKGIMVWRSYAQKAFSRKRPGIFACNFNKWFISREYREELSRFLNETPSEKGVNRILTTKSAFDIRRFDGRAQEMKVLDRWKMLDDEGKKLIRANPDLVELTKKIFDGFEINLNTMIRVR